ncbi:MAG: LysR family transcriptional regulator [Actinomycetota bacterium]
MSELHDLDGLTPSRLRAVLAVAETGSFSAAAREVSGSQSGVSRSVAAVEAVLGTAIFDRSTRSVRLTDAGREFVERATLVRAELEAAVRAARPDRRPAPRLTIAALTSVSELHLADALVGSDEGWSRLRCVEGLQSVVEQTVVSGRATIGIGDLADVPAELVVRPLWHEPFRLAVPRGHRLARRRAVGLDDLVGEPLVGFSRDAELRTTIDRELATARQLRAPEIVVDRFRTALSIVAAGLGVMVVPAIVGRALPAGARLVELDHPDLRRTMGVLRRPDAAVSPALDALVDRLVDAVAATPDLVVDAGSTRR